MAEETLIGGGEGTGNGTSTGTGGDGNGGQGGGGSTQSTPPSVPAALVGADGAFAPGWLDNLPAELQPNRSQFERFQNIGDLARSYHSAQQMIGKSSGAVFVPGEKSTPEEVAKWRKAVGAPESPEGYNLKPEKLPEGLQWDDELGKAFAQIAHKHHVPAAAMKELSERYLASEAARAEEYGKVAAQQLADGRAELQKAFGANYDKRIALAARMAGAVGLDTASPGLRDPNVVKALVRMSDLIAEDRLPAAGASTQSGGLNFKAIMTDPSNPYFKRYKDGDPETVALVRDLMRANA